MSKNFEFNAPQFVNFSNLDDPEGDSFFGRKFENLHVSEVTSIEPKSEKKTSKLLKSGRKSHHMITRLDVINNRLDSDSPSSEINVTNTKDTNPSASNKKVIHKIPKAVNFNKMKRAASPLASTKKFISLAEQVEHFYDTPDRFRSRPNKKPTSIPKTPKLLAKFRQRKINFPDEKQREEMELEEMKKHQVKAHPLNEKILMGPSLNLKVPIIKKPTTVPQPFSLTEVKKKEHSEETVFQFKAQPLPFSILQGPIGIPPKKITAPTVPTTPQIRVPHRYRVGIKTPVKTPEVDGSNVPRKTVVQPFSFDERMKEMLQKKQNFINKVLEEEKKGFNSFKAHPMPAFKNKCDGKFKTEKCHTTTPQPFHLTQRKFDKGTPDQRPPTTLYKLNILILYFCVRKQKITPFKAKPATVVHQKPFVPKLQKHDMIVTSDFHLSTEKRAVERLKFDEKIKQKEEELNLALKLQKEEEERLEKERALEERKKAEFKAKPMPRYKAFEIYKADPEKLTLPQSPRFVSKTKDLKKD
ncbi:conserved hypothetical protein [Pediculus humanus corporis]|uniref:Targeting protein for Xklp2 n=1 Tax=Pediculus humanus subsp. corporis TaxID=121224 RepID=E0VFQ0_PEDHC|nr:uncharacterized protein Phum_PHUM164080 [Pediculus humanus corporis]EEB12206.1 conserved hypothetical protein [Pediculus humanus corporis]